MARRGLGDLADQTTTDLATHTAPAPAATSVNDGPRPHYLTLTRKEARVRDDQAESLTSLTRRLNKTRAGTGERITENTIIRVAIDLLLSRDYDLTGTTETELRNSVGL